MANLLLYKHKYSQENKNIYRHNFYAMENTYSFDTLFKLKLSTIRELLPTPFLVPIYDVLIQ